MFVLSEYVRQAERVMWKRKFGTDFTGWHEGRRIQYTWREHTVGHICFGDIEQYGHLKCQRIVAMGWVWLRLKAGT